MGNYRRGIYLVNDNVIDAKRALNSWAEKNYRQKLYTFPSGEYYMEYLSDHQGLPDFMRHLPKKEAAQWLIFNEYSLPEDLA